MRTYRVDNEKRKRNSSGFIALMSAVIISSILVGLLFTSGSGGLSVRIDELNRELKKQSEHLAQSCINIAFLRMKENYIYTPQTTGDIVSIDGSTCTIDSVVYDPENILTHTKTAVIKTHAQFRGTWTNFLTHISLASPLYSHIPPTPQVTIISEEEI